MELSLKESIEKLERLTPARLHQTSRRIRKELGGSEWKLGACLLAAVRTGAFRKLGYPTISRYAERALHISGKKAGALLSAARVLEHHPLISEAYRDGTLGWGKLRAIKGLVTPETEQQWLEFCLEHDTDAVANKVALSPRAWKRYRALQASLQENPMIEAKELAAILEAEPETLPGQSGLSSPQSDEERGLPGAGKSSPGDIPPISSRSACDVPAGDDLAETSTCGKGAAPAASRQEQSPLGGKASAAPDEPPSEPKASPEPRPLPFAPQRIRVVIEMSPDQYALFERAESRVRAQVQKRIARAEVVTAMAEAVLNAGTARSRAKHQVLIHKDAETGVAWYDSQRGPLPVSPELVEKAQGERKPMLIMGGQLQEEGAPSEITRDATPHPESTRTFRDRRTSGQASEPLHSRGSESKSLSREMVPSQCSVMAAQPIKLRSAQGYAQAPQPNLAHPKQSSKAKLPGKPQAASRQGATQAKNSVPLKLTKEESHDAPSKAMGPVQSPPPSPKLNRSIPNNTLRRLFAQAGQRCQSCGDRTGPFEVHHTTPFSEGGTHQLRCLRLLCQACHSLAHQGDFESKGHWAAAKARNCGRRLN